VIATVAFASVSGAGHDRELDRVEARGVDDLTDDRGAAVGLRLRDDRRDDLDLCCEDPA
jgi:hypothetical protein